MTRLLISTLTLLVSACGGSSGGDNSPTNEPQPEPRIEHLSGGTTSTADNSADAFSARSDNMIDTNRIAQFELGDDFFQNPWVAGSASTSSRDGLGGLFNNNACQDCHIRDGRGHAPNAGSDDFNSILFKATRTDLSQEQRLAMLAGTLSRVGDASVGSQLQHAAVATVQPEVELSVSYQVKTVTFADGHQVELRKPQWQIVNLRQTEGHSFNNDTLFSARVAPPMIGLGLLALIPESDILMREDPTDADNDGISGKANRVWSIERQHQMLGRFGWKAGQPSVLEQTAGAFVNDMGLTNRLHLSENCMPHQTDCLTTPNGNGDSVNDYNYEVSDPILDAVGFYSHHLSVPQRRNAYDADVQAGKALFNQLNCQGCHTAQYTTEYASEHPELSEQVIFPYTDLLLHDMGPELADFDINGNAAAAEQLTEFSALASEWRTPPLWGLGRTKTVDPEATLLHDGRARTIMEAILWHGGEAQAGTDKVLQLNANERAQLLSFLNDL